MQAGITRQPNIQMNKTKISIPVPYNWVLEAAIRTMGSTDLVPVWKSLFGENRI